MLKQNFALVCFGLALCQGIGAAELRAFQPEDGKAWRAIGEERLTPDGRWLVYALRPDVASTLDTMEFPAEGESVAVVRGTHSQVERRYSMGAGDGSLQFSSDMSRFAFIRLADGQKSCAVVTVSSGEQHEVPHAEECVFAGKGGARLLVKNPAGAEKHGFVLSLHDLTGKQIARYADIDSYSLSPDGVLLVTAGAGGLTWRNLQNATAVEMPAASGGTYSQWTWAPGNRALAALREEQGRDPQLAIVQQTKSSRPRLTVQGADAWPQFPRGARIQGSFVWREDAAGVFFNFNRASSPLPAGKPGDAAIWHSRADKIPGQVAWQQKRTGFFPLLGIVWLADGRAVALTDGSLQEVQPRSRGRYLMGFDDEAHGWKGNWDDKAQHLDYDLIDVRTGARTALLRDLPVYVRGGKGVPRMSPDGQTVVWRDAAGDYKSRDLTTGKTVELTRFLPVRFFHPENDPARSRQLLDDDLMGGWGIQGWVPDRDSVLISDWYDIWELPLRGGNARNVTADGRRRNVRYVLDALTLGSAGSELSLYIRQYAIQTGELPVSSRRPWYFFQLEEDTAREGFARLDVGARRPRDLTWDAVHTRYLNAADIWLVERSDALEPRNFYRLDSNWQRVEQLTDSNPQQREFHWPPPPKFLTYTTSRGDKRHAALFLPAGYQPGKHYPTITFIYQQRSSVVHNYNPFGVEVYPWLWSGYAVLSPDIVPRADEPGKAAVESVSAAIDAGVAAGVIDRDRVGVSGHSWGGYETFYLATRTSLFKAAAPHAGITDLLCWSGVVYGDIYDGRAGGVHPGIEATGSIQPFVPPAWWDNWDAMIENSPLYHVTGLKTPLLIAHGDRDNNVRFEQAEKMFSGLRLAGNPDVVLLQYPGEGHEFRPEARRDYRMRLRQFFDHFLKGAPAPAWWTDGKSWPAGAAPKQ